ncbi:MAG: hypothetical protein H6741_15955 [Alphaproteobacteria bacterium]|nr:hypothetical protein [Alphaproteobacteria bacterium]
MWWMLLSAAWAAPLSELADEAVALQRAQGQPVIVALPDSASEAAWSRLELPGDVLLVATQARDEASAFAAVQGLDCGLLVTGEGPEGYAAEPFGACAEARPGDVPGGPDYQVPRGWASTHDWAALGLSASTLALAPKLHYRLPTDFGMLGVTAGFSWFGARGSVQLTTRPRQGGTGLYLGGEAMLRALDAVTVAGAAEAAANTRAYFDAFEFWTGDEPEYQDEEPLSRRVPAFGLAPILGGQYISPDGLFLAAQVGPQLLLLSGNGLVAPVQMRLSGQLLVGFVPRGWRGRDNDSG